MCFSMKYCYETILKEKKKKKSKQHQPIDVKYTNLQYHS